MCLQVGQAVSYILIVIFLNFYAIPLYVSLWEYCVCVITEQVIQYDFDISLYK